MGIDKTVYYYHCEKTSKLALLKMQSHNVGNYNKKTIFLLMFWLFHTALINP